MTEQEAIELLQNLNVKLTDMSGHKANGIEKIFGWNYQSLKVRNS